MKIVNKLKFVRFISICIGLMFVGGYIAYAQFNKQEVITYEPLDYALESVEITQEIDYIVPIIPTSTAETNVVTVDDTNIDTNTNINTDIELLSKVLYSEINYAYRNGRWVLSTDEEMGYVGQVVLNRVDANGFGDTLEDVVFAKTQFCSVRSDTWGVTTERTDRIAKEVIQGKYDIDDEIYYFFNPDIATNTAFVKAKMPLVVFEAGGHVFTK